MATPRIVSDVSLPEYLNDAMVCLTRAMAHAVSTHHPFDEGGHTCALKDLDEAEQSIACAREALKKRTLSQAAVLGSPH